MFTVKTKRPELICSFFKCFYTIVVVLCVSLLMQGCIRTQRDIIMEEDLANIKKSQKVLEDEQSQKELFLRKSVISKDQSIEDLRTEIKILTGRLEENSFNQGKEVKEQIAPLQGQIQLLKEEIERQKIEIEGLKKVKETPKPQQAVSQLDMRELYNRAYARYTNKQYNEALSDFQELLKRFPTTHYRENIHYFSGSILFNLRKYEEAILAYEEIVKRFPASKRLAEVNLNQGMCFMKTGATNDAKYFFNQVISKYPGSSEAKRASVELKKIK